jgi:flagellar basal body P-ring formation protein FlgA
MMRFFRMIRAVFYATLILSTTVAQAAPEAEFTVRFKNQVEVADEKIVLADLAVITGPDCAMKNDLEQVYITRAPMPGRSTNIRRTYIEHRLKSSGLPLNDVDIDIPEQVGVVRGSQSIDEQWVRQIVEEYLAGIEPYKSRPFEIVNLRTGTLPDLPLGELDFRIMPKRSTTATRIGMSIYLSVDGKDAGHLRISGQVDLTVKAIVPVRRMERGQRIEAGDLIETELSLARVSKGALTDIKQAVGMVSRQRLEAGEPVLDRDLEPSTVIARGDIVNILAVSGPIKVSARGEAKRDGALGDNIAVLNLSSKKIITAQVIDAETVRVNF